MNIHIVLNYFKVICHNISIKGYVKIPQNKTIHYVIPPFFFMLVPLFVCH